MKEKVNVSAKAQQEEQIKCNTNETLNKETMEREVSETLELFLESKEDFESDILITEEQLPTIQNQCKLYTIEPLDSDGIFGYFTDLYFTVDWQSNGLPKISLTTEAKNMYDFMIWAASNGERFVFYFEPKCCIWHDYDEAIGEYKEKLYVCTLLISKWFNDFKGQMSIFKLR